MGGGDSFPTNQPLRLSILSHDETAFCSNKFLSKAEAAKCNDGMGLDIRRTRAHESLHGKRQRCLWAHFLDN